MFFIDLINDYKSYFETIYICNIIWDAFLTSYLIFGKDVDKPLVFKFNLEKDSKVCLSIFNKDFKFNKEFSKIVRPFSLVIATVNNEGKISNLDGDFTINEDINFEKFLLIGTYYIWIYCSYIDAKIENNFSYTFRIASENNNNLEFLFFDNHFTFISNLYLNFKKNYYENLKQQPSNYILVTDPILKKAGLQTIYGSNFGKKEIYINYTIKPNKT